MELLSRRPRWGQCVHVAYEQQRHIQQSPEHPELQAWRDIVSQYSLAGWLRSSESSNLPLPHLVGYLDALLLAQGTRGRDIKVNARIG